MRSAMKIIEPVSMGTSTTLCSMSWGVPPIPTLTGVAAMDWRRSEVIWRPISSMRAAMR